MFGFAMVAMGGAIGAVLRYGILQIMSPVGDINWGTFAANFIGCFLICFIFFRFADMGEATRVFLFIGVFGAFTTMSSVSIEMVQLSTAGMAWHSFLVFLLNAIVCLGAGFLGRNVALFSL